MLVKELIEQLQALPQDALLVTSGYEGGLNEISGASSIQIILNVNKAWYYGPHEEAPSGEIGDLGAVYIG